MGRYITGDIERKLWFAVQNSNAADRFGVTGYEPAYLEYQFEQDDLLKVLRKITDRKSFFQRAHTDF
jgi:hypothetical protein